MGTPAWVAAGPGGNAVPDELFETGVDVDDVEAAQPHASIATASRGR